MNCREREPSIRLLAEDRLENNEHEEQNHEREELLAHLDECETCQTLFESLLREPVIDDAVMRLRETVPEAGHSHTIPASSDDTTGNRLENHHARNRWLRFVSVAAAVVLFAFVWFLFPSGNDSNRVYASMLNMLGQVETARFKEINNAGVKTIHYQTATGFWRREDSNSWGYYAIGVFDGKDLAWTIPKNKFIDIQRNAYYPSMVHKPFWEQILDKISLATRDRIFLGEREIDGIQTLGYQVTLPDGGAFTKRTEIIWIDKQTKLPVLVESRSVFSYNTLSEESLKRAKEQLAQRVRLGLMTQEQADQQIANNMKPKNVTETYSDFQWNVELDPGLFQISPPEGYTINEIDNKKEFLKRFEELGYIDGDSEELQKNLRNLGYGKGSKKKSSDKDEERSDPSETEALGYTGGTNKKNAAKNRQKAMGYIK